MQASVACLVILKQQGRTWLDVCKKQERIAQRQIVHFSGAHHQNWQHEAQGPRKHSQNTWRVLPLWILLVSHHAVQQLRNIPWVLSPLDCKTEQCDGDVTARGFCSGFNQFESQECVLGTRLCSGLQHEAGAQLWRGPGYGMG